MENRIKINGEVHTIEEIHDYATLLIVELDDGTEWYLAESSEAAGEKAREYWEDLANDDPQEFACLIGEDTLIQWGMNQSAGPGSTKVNCLQEWLDLWLDIPEEQWASYDGNECNVDRIGKAIEEIGFIPTVAYRHN